MKNSINKNILFQNFEGTTTPLQKKMIEEWLQQPENIELYYDWLNEWEGLKPQFNADGTLPLQRIMDNSSIDEAATIPVQKRSFIYRFLQLKYAAAIIIVVALSASGFLLKDTIFYKSIHTAFGETRSIVLPDGSLVTLNANSTIKFPRFGFGQQSREVYLTGEADFSVSHTQTNQQFLVKTNNNLEVVVLGTQFTVYARQNKATVVLRQGKVQLNYGTLNAIKNVVMKPGDLFTASANGTQQLKQVQNPEKLAAWKNHDFLFEATTLREIAKMIKDNYDVDLTFEDDDLARKEISGSFHADTVEELINVLAQVLQVNFNTKEKTVYFFE